MGLNVGFMSNYNFCSFLRFSEVVTVALAKCDFRLTSKQNLANIKNFIVISLITDVALLSAVSTSLLFINRSTGNARLSWPFPDPT